jgi:formate-dependent phosphoribosylglycinamide formyltransferase (GAR transformylase)
MLNEYDKVWSALQISGARVKLFENPAPNGERRLDIIGVKSQIMSAQNLIQVIAPLQD